MNRAGARRLTIAPNEEGESGSASDDSLSEAESFSFFDTPSAQQNPDRPVSPQLSSFGPPKSPKRYPQSGGGLRGSHGGHTHGAPPKSPRTGKGKAASLRANTVGGGRARSGARPRTATSPKARFGRKASFRGEADATPWAKGGAGKSADVDRLVGEDDMEDLVGGMDRMKDSDLEVDLGEPIRTPVDPVMDSVFGGEGEGSEEEQAEVEVTRPRVVLRRKLGSKSGGWKVGRQGSKDEEEDRDAKRPPRPKSGRYTTSQPQSVSVDSIATSAGLGDGKGSKAGEMEGEAAASGVTNQRGTKQSVLSVGGKGDNADLGAPLSADIKGAQLSVLERLKSKSILTPTADALMDRLFAVDLGGPSAYQREQEREREREGGKGKWEGEGEVLMFGRAKTIVGLKSGSGVAGTMMSEGAAKFFAEKDAEVQREGERLVYQKAGTVVGRTKTRDTGTKVVGEGVRRKEAQRGADEGGKEGRDRSEGYHKAKTVTCRGREAGSSRHALEQEGREDVGVSSVSQGLDRVVRKGGGDSVAEKAAERPRASLEEAKQRARAMEEFVGGEIDEEEEDEDYGEIRRAKTEKKGKSRTKEGGKEGEGEGEEEDGVDINDIWKEVAEERRRRFLMEEEDQEEDLLEAVMGRKGMRTPREGAPAIDPKTPKPKKMGLSLSGGALGESKEAKVKKVSRSKKSGSKFVEEEFGVIVEEFMNQPQGRSKTLRSKTINYRDGGPGEQDR